jgi:hypothetical protein
LSSKNWLGLKLLLALFAAGSFSSLFATGNFPACVSGTVASYIAVTANPPASGGCANGVLDYFDFKYIAGSNAPDASNIAVAPLGTGFTFGPVTAAPNETVQFEIDYDIVIDPAPIITGGRLRLDPPTGDVTVTEFFCNDTQYIGGGLCLGSIPAQSLTVGTPGTNFPDTASISFDPTAKVSQQVGIVFTLNGGVTGASFDGLDSVSVVVVSAPEPATAPGLLLGLLALAAGYKLKKQRNRAV